MEGAELTMEGEELMEVHIKQKLHTMLYMAEDEVAGEQKLDGIWQNWQTSDLSETGEAYNGGFLIIKAVDLYWRGE